MHIMVLGGAGLTAQCAVRDLLETTDWKVTIGDSNFKKARKLPDQLKDRRVSAELVDVRQHDETVRVIKGADVVINGVQYYYNINVMKACLEAGVSYIDFGGLYYMTKEQLEWNLDFKKAGLFALIGIGAQPGVSNVMIRYAADRLDSVETVRIRDGWKDSTVGAPPFLVTWSFATVMDELTFPAIIFENGKFKKVPPLTGKETITFPEPVGQQDVYLTLHSELATVPHSFKEKGLKNVDWKEGGPDFIRLKLLVDMALTSDKPIKVKGIEIAPRDFLLGTLNAHRLIGYPDNVEPNDYETTKVEVIGKKGGKDITYVLDAVFPAKKEWHASCSQYNVGVPASIVAQMLACRKIRQKGVLPPERCVDPEYFFNELAKRDIRIYVQVKKPVN